VPARQLLAQRLPMIAPLAERVVGQGTGVLFFEGLGSRALTMSLQCSGGTRTPVLVDRSLKSLLAPGSAFARRVQDPRCFLSTMNRLVGRCPAELLRVDPETRAPAPREAGRARGARWRLAAPGVLTNALPGCSGH